MRVRDSLQAAAAAAELSRELVRHEDRFVWDIEPTRLAAERILRAAEELGDAELVMRARLVLANMALRGGKPAGEAVRVIGQAQAWAADHGVNVILARGHLLFAQVSYYLADLPQCVEHSVKAVELLDDTASSHVQIWHRVKLADALSWAGSADAARERYLQAEQLALALGETRLHMAALNNHAYAEYESGRPEHALAVMRQLLTLAESYGTPLDPADFDTLGRIQIETGAFADAEATMRHCLAIHAQGHHENLEVLAEYLLTLATAQRGLGQLEGAQDSLTTSRALCVERGLTDVAVRVQQEQAELFAARGDYAAAFEAHKRFFAEFDKHRSNQRVSSLQARQTMFDLADAKRRADEAHTQARRDPLTGQWNRRYVDESLPGLMAEAIVTHTPLAVAILDLDHFKQINDTLSHDVGDQVLVTMSKIVESELAVLSPRGFLARTGGEEFLIVLPSTDLADATECLERIRVAIRSYDWSGITRGRPVTASIGVAVTGAMAGAGTGPGTDQAGLLSTADRNLYAAKHAGRDRVVSDPDDEHRRRRYRDAPRPE